MSRSRRSRCASADATPAASLDRARLRRTNGRSKHTSPPHPRRITRRAAMPGEAADASRERRAVVDGRAEFRTRTTTRCSAFPRSRGGCALTPHRCTRSGAWPTRKRCTCRSSFRPAVARRARELDIPTNHADLIPALLGLTGETVHGPADAEPSVVRGDRSQLRASPSASHLRREGLLKRVAGPCLFQAVIARADRRCSGQVVRRQAPGSPGARRRSTAGSRRRCSRGCTAASGAADGGR